MATRPLPAHPKLTHVTTDLRDPRAKTALAGVDVLWHLGFRLWRTHGAGLAGGGGGGGGDTNLVATANVLAAGPRRVVYASSAAVYGAWPDNPLPLLESDPTRPNRECAYARQKLAAERMCCGEAPTAVLRIGAVLGAHADARIARATRGYRRVVPAIRGVLEALQFVGEDDVASALLAAGMSGAAGVWNIATHDWMSAADIAALAGGRVLRLPRALLVGASEAVFRLGLVPFGADRAALLNGPLALDCGLAARELGWHPTLRSAEVLAAALAPAAAAAAP